MEFLYSSKEKSALPSFANKIGFFLRGAIYSYKALFTWLVPQVYVLTKIINPLFQILFFTYLGKYYTHNLGSSYYAIGNAVQICALNCIQGISMTIANERVEGTLIQVLGTPASRIRIFISRSLMHIIDALLTVFIGFLFSSLFLGVSFSNTNFILLAITSLVTIFSTSCLGLFVGSFGLALRESNLLSNLTYFLLIIFCGINYPVYNLPIIMQKISFAIPLTRGVEAIRKIISGASFADIYSLIGYEIIVGIVYMILGFILFKVFDLYSRKIGSFESY